MMERENEVVLGRFIGIFVYVVFVFFVVVFVIKFCIGRGVVDVEVDIELFNFFKDVGI